GIAQVVIGERIGNLHGHRVRLLASGAARAPAAQSPVAASLFAMKDVFQNGLLKKIELRTIAKKTRLVDGEIFQKGIELHLPFTTGEQSVITVEAIEAACFQAALQPVLQEMNATFVEMHSAFLVDKCLQELEFCVADDDWNTDSGHLALLNFYSPVFLSERCLRGHSGSCCDGKVSDPSQLALLQNLREVDQNHETPVQLAYSSYILHFVLFEDFRGSFDLFVRYA